LQVVAEGEHPRTGEKSDKVADAAGTEDFNHEGEPNTLALIAVPGTRSNRESFDKTRKPADRSRLLRPNLANSKLTRNGAVPATQGTEA
jgi:hypothetical protein